MVLKQSRCHEPPEDVAAEKSLRQRRLATADGEMDAVCARELARDLVPVFPPPTTNTVPCGMWAGAR